MSLAKFFRTIDNSFIGKFVDRKLNVLKNTDPERIYVENIRSFYNISFSAARFFCEMAVRENIFIKKIALTCPNSECGRIIISIDKKSDIPKEIRCEQCEMLERDEFEFKLTEKNVTEFYKLNILSA